MWIEVLAVCGLVAFVVGLYGVTSIWVNRIADKAWHDATCIDVCHRCYKGEVE